MKEPCVSGCLRPNKKGVAVIIENANVWQYTRNPIESDIVCPMTKKSNRLAQNKKR